MKFSFIVLLIVAILLLGGCSPSNQVDNGSLTEQDSLLISRVESIRKIPYPQKEKYQRLYDSIKPFADESPKALVLLQLTDAKRKKGRLKIESLKKVAIAAKENRQTEYLSQCYSDIGYSYFSNFARFDSAYLFCRLAIQVIENDSLLKNDVNNILVNPYRALAEIYLYCGDASSWEENISMALNIAENPASKSRMNKLMLYAAIQQGYALQGKLDSSLKYASLLKRSMGGNHSVYDKIGLANQQYNIGNYQSAQKILNEIDLLQGIPPSSKCQVYQLSAAVFFKQGFYSKAEEMLDSSTLYTNGHYHYLKNTYKQYAELYEKMEDYYKSHESLKLYYAYEDSLNKTRTVNNLKLIEGKIALSNYNNALDKEVTAKRSIVKELTLVKIQRWLFAGIAVLLLLIPIIYLNQRSKKRKKEYQVKLAQMQMASLKCQMSPHFMFNSINSIKGLIINDAAEAAADQLTKFSKLMRNILNYSGDEKISLSKELEFIRLYTDLETYRSHQNVKLNVEVDAKIDLENTEILPFIIQPFIENCFKHAFTSDVLKPHINLVISFKSDYLYISVEDNGIGIKRDKKVLHESKGTALVEKRLELYNGNKNNINWDYRGENLGTAVRIKHLYRG
jgi:two-component sensor histidine kinase